MSVLRLWHASKVADMANTFKTHTGKLLQLPSRISILGVGVDNVTVDESVRLIDGMIAMQGCFQIATINPEFVMEAQRDVRVMHVLNNAVLATPDGVGIMWAARWFGTPLRERVTGVQLVDRVAKHAAIRGWRMYFLGAAPGVAERAAQVLRHRYKGLIVAGCYAGSPSIIEEPFVREQLQDAQVDILLVAYGHPAQELWIARNQTMLGIPVAIGVGGTFDELAGVVPLAPAWMERFGLKWLWRLIQQPQRLNRILTATVRFPLAVIRASLSKKST